MIWITLSHKYARVAYAIRQTLDAVDTEDAHVFRVRYNLLISTKLAYTIRDNIDISLGVQIAPSDELKLSLVERVFKLTIPSGDVNTSESALTAAFSGEVCKSILRCLNRPPRPFRPRPLIRLLLLESGLNVGDSSSSSMMMRRLRSLAAALVSCTPDIGVSGMHIALSKMLGSVSSMEFDTMPGMKVIADVVGGGDDGGCGDVMRFMVAGASLLLVEVIVMAIDGEVCGGSGGGGACVCSSGSETIG